MFSDGDNRVSVKESTASKPHIEPVHDVEQSFSMIHLREVCICVLTDHHQLDQYLLWIYIFIMCFGFCSPLLS